MTRRKKIAFAAGAAGAVVLIAGLGAAGAIAGSRMLSPAEESKAVIDDAASQLGVEPSELAAALKEAMKNRVERAVADGRLTREQAERLEERIDSSDYPTLGGLWSFGRGMHRAFGFGHFHHFALLEAAAEYLGLTDAELRDELQDKTLADIAKEQGKTPAGLVQQLVATQTKRIDEAVEDGELTDEQATRLKSNLEQRMEALVDGELRRRGGAPQHRFWPGSGAPRAPPAFGGPRA